MGSFAYILTVFYYCCFWQNGRTPPVPTYTGHSPSDSSLRRLLSSKETVKYTCLRLKADSDLIGTLPDYSKQFNSSVRSFILYLIYSYMKCACCSDFTTAFISFGITHSSLFHFPCHPAFLCFCIPCLVSAVHRASSDKASSCLKVASFVCHQIKPNWPANQSTFS